MAVVTLKSTKITNRDASPLALTTSAVSGGSLREEQGWVTTNNGDSATSEYVLLTVPSNCRISSLVYQCDALGAGCTINVGAYKNTKQGGAVISSTFFASAINSAAANAATEILNQAGNNTLDKQEMPLWQALGLSVDPGDTIDIVANVAVATAAAGKIGLKAKYSI